MIATLSWQAASVYMTGIAAAALVIAVLTWSIFRTGQTAIRTEAEGRLNRR